MDRVENENDATLAEWQDLAQDAKVEMRIRGLTAEDT
jgi:hypothetical protein